MDETFVTVDLTEFEFDALIEFLGEQEIQSSLYRLYDKLLAAASGEDDDEVESLIADEE